MALLIIGGIWIACGFASYGLGVAEWRRQFPLSTADDPISFRRFHATMAIFGPFNLITALIFTRFGKHGWML